MAANARSMSFFIVNIFYSQCKTTSQPCWSEIAAPAIFEWNNDLAETAMVMGVGTNKYPEAGPVNRYAGRSISTPDSLYGGKYYERHQTEKF
jgi:hypothetical protein